MEYPTFYRTTQIDGLSIFYREAGPRDAPTLLLLHGLPSSSRMFEPLLARLSDRYHLVAPDYPGFGHSDWPDPKRFEYTFDHYAEILNHFTEALGLSRYTLYMQDYGGPVGFRMVLAHPDRIEALIVQNAVAHNEGLGAIWKLRRAFWADRVANEATLRANLLSLPTTRTRHVGNDPNVERYDPDLWTDEFAFLNQSGQADIQTDLFYDYRTNVDAYPRWQAWMREHQPPLLVLWGRYDPSFDLSEPEAYRRDVPKAEVHVLDAGHFALHTGADQIARLVRGFMTNTTMSRPHQPDEAVFHAIRSEDLEWKPFEAFPPDARLAVLVGDPNQPGPYVIRVRLPAGTKMMPHKHPEDRIYTVLSGVFYIGLGEEFDESRLTAYGVGTVIVLPGDQPHFHWAKSGEYMTQVTAIGPLGLTYVHPADDPRSRLQPANAIEASRHNH